MALVSTAVNLEPLPAIGLLATGLFYAFGVERLRGRRRSWPITRSISFWLGLGVIAIATQSPLAGQDVRLFSAHMAQHLLLALIAPPLLCLGAPITLFLQAASRPWQQGAVRVLHSRAVRVLTFPVTSWMIYTGTLFILYFSGLYELSLHNRVVHDLVHLHFLVAGFLYFSAVVAIDPHPWRMPHGLRMLYVGLQLPAHAFLALALISGTKPIAGYWYVTTTGRDVATILTDQKLGAAIMWIAGDFLSVVWIGIIVMQWVREDERAQAREDRAVDAEANAYT